MLGMKEQFLGSELSCKWPRRDILKWRTCPLNGCKLKIFMSEVGNSYKKGRPLIVQWEKRVEEHVREKVGESMMRNKLRMYEQVF